MNDATIEHFCGRAAFEMVQVYALAMGNLGDAWGDQPPEEHERWARLVEFVLAGGTPQSMHEARRKRLVEKGLGGLSPLDVSWERLPPTQAKRDMLIVTTINAMALVLGHSKRPVTIDVTMPLEAQHDGERRTRAGDERG